MDEKSRKQLTQELQKSGGRHCETTFEGLPALVWYNQARTFGIYGFLLVFLFLVFVLYIYSYGHFASKDSILHINIMQFVTYGSDATGYTKVEVYLLTFVVIVLFCGFLLWFSFSYEADDVSYCYLAWYDGRVVAVFDLGLHGRIRGLQKRKKRMIDYHRIMEIIHGSLVHWSDMRVNRTTSKKGHVISTNENFSCIVVKGMDETGRSKSFILKDYPVQEPVNHLVIIEDLSFFENFFINNKKHYIEFLMPAEEVEKGKRAYM